MNADITRQDDTGPVAHAKTPLTFGVIGDSTAVPAFSPLDAILGAVEDQFGVVLDPLRERLLTEIAGGRVSDDPRVVFQDAPTHTKIESRGVSATLASKLGAVDAKLIGGFRDSRRDVAVDLDLTDFPGFAFVPPSFTSGRQTSLELQLSSAFQPPWVGEVRAIAGAFLYDETGREIWTVRALALAPDAPEELGDLVPPEVYPLFQSGGLSRLLFHTRQETRSYAGFADLEWDALDRLLLRFGSRYTADRKRAVGSIQSPDPTSACQDNRESDSWDAFTLRTGADVPWDEDRLFYVSFSQGFKAGGFNPQACNSGPYDPEFVDAIELGMKSRWLDRRLQLNVSGFFYDFTDIQVEKVVGFATEVVNAATAEIRGVELEMVGLLPADLSIDGSLAWLDATYTDFFDDDPFTLADPSGVDLSGNRVTKSPEWTGSLGAQAVQEIGRLATATARLEWSYTASMFYDHFNHDFARAASYQVWNLFLNLERPDSRLGLQGFVKNLTDELYVVGQVTPSTLAGGPFTYYSMPRTWGLELYARF